MRLFFWVVFLDALFQFLAFFDQSVAVLIGQAEPQRLIGRRFWFEGAVRGNPLAQQSLADCLMEEAAQTGDEDTRLLASILFAIAAQQGNDEAIEALSRVVQFDLSRRGVQSEEDFMASPVVQVAQAAMSEI